MGMMLGSLYQALIDAKVTEERARRAAEEVALFETRLVPIERDLTLLKWMVGFNLALCLLMFGKLWTL